MYLTLAGTLALPLRHTPSKVSEATLGLAPGRPVVELIRTTCTGDGQPAEVSEMVADASAYVFRYEFTA